MGRSPGDDEPGGQYRVFRGGSWGDPPEVVRVSFRWGYDPGFSGNHLGFRCAGERM